MRVLLATSELNPYSKTGGLADMVAALAKALGAAGHQVGVVTPLYRSIWSRHQPVRMDWHMTLPLGGRTVSPEIWTLQPHPGVTVYFVHAPEFFDREGIYGDERAAYVDNADRFIAFSKAVLHLARYLPWQPEVLPVGVLLCLGVLTPILASFAAVAFAARAFADATLEPAPVSLMLCATALALLGPGAYSFDAWRFGRRIVVASDAGDPVE